MRLSRALEETWGFAVRGSLADTAIAWIAPEAHLAVAIMLLGSHFELNQESHTSRDGVGDLSE